MVKCHNTTRHDMTRQDTTHRDIQVLIETEGPASTPMYRGDDDGDGKGDTKYKPPTTYHVTITYMQDLHIYTVDRGP